MEEGIESAPADAFTPLSVRTSGIIRAHDFARAIDQHERWLDTMGEEGERLVIEGDPEKDLLVVGDASGRDLTLAWFRHVNLNLTSTRTSYAFAMFGEGTRFQTYHDATEAEFDHATFRETQLGMIAPFATFRNARFLEGATLMGGVFVFADFTAAQDETGGRSFAGFNPYCYIREDGIATVATEQERRCWGQYSPECSQLRDELLRIQNTAAMSPECTSAHTSEHALAGKKPRHSVLAKFLGHARPA